MSCGATLHGRACPGEVNECVGSPAVAQALGRVERPQPPDLDEVFSGRLDTAQVDAEDLGNPGGFAPATAAAALLAVVEAAEEVSKYGGDDRRFQTASNEAHGVAWHRHAAVVVDNGLVHREEIGEILDASEVCGSGGKGQSGAGPGEQAEGLQTVEGGSEIFPTDATDEPVEFTWRVVRDLIRRKLAAPRDHLLRGTPDAEVHELDEPSAVGPPEETELLDRQKHESPDRLACRAFRIWGCGHVASLVCGRTEIGCPLSREGSV